jgi:hypothetical protein
MTLSEFRAWLEGYSASFTDGTPNADQWAEIQRRIQGVQVFVAPVNVPANSIPQVWPCHTNWQPPMPVTCIATNVA